MTGDRSLSIDAMRGAAVMMVVLNHAVIPEGTGVAAFDAFMSFFYRFGGHGVDVFFVLSGFCIHWAYSRGGKPFDLRKYAARRWTRIYPPYFFALAFSLWLHLLFAGKKVLLGEEVPLHAFGAWQAFTHLFLVHNLFVSAIMRINGPFWTLGLEAQFYALYPAVRKHLSGARQWAVLLAVAAVLWAVSWRLGPFGDFQPQHIFRFWFEWLVGAFAVFLFRRHEAFVRKLRWTWLLLAAAAVLATTRWPLHPASVHLGFALGSFFLVLGIFKWERPFESRALGWLPAVGYFSYSIYLLHYPVLDRWTRTVPALTDNALVRVAATAAGVAAILAASRVFFHFFERPFLHTPKPLEASAAP